VYKRKERAEKLRSSVNKLGLEHCDKPSHCYGKRVEGESLCEVKRHYMKNLNLLR